MVQAKFFTHFIKHLQKGWLCEECSIPVDPSVKGYETYVSLHLFLCVFIEAKCLLKFRIFQISENSENYIK